jgi:hypothetical protein
MKATNCIKYVNAEELLGEQNGKSPELDSDEDFHSCEIRKKPFSRRNDLSEHTSANSKKKKNITF